MIAQLKTKKQKIKTKTKKKCRKYLKHLEKILVSNSLDRKPQES